MILTLTPSPSLDLNYELPHLDLGNLNRTAKGTFVAGGKGLNVSRILSKMKVSTKAIVPIRRDQVELFLNSTHMSGRSVEVVNVAGSIRFNVSILHDGETTKINAETPGWSEKESTEIIQVFKTKSRRSSFSVIGGALPAGTPTEWLRQLVLDTRNRTRVVVDCSGDALRAAVRAKPFLIKPNLHEAEELLEFSIDTPVEIRKACESIIKMGVSNVLLSLGAKGSVFYDGQTFWQGSPKKIDVVNTVGAGDALLAGFLGAYKTSPSMALANGMAWSEAAIISQGTDVSADSVQQDLSRVKVVPNGNFNFESTEVGQL